MNEIGKALVDMSGLLMKPVSEICTMDANEYIPTATLGRVLRISLQESGMNYDTFIYGTKWKIKQRESNNSPYLLS